MGRPTFLLFGCLFMMLACEALTMQCDGSLGLLSCPNRLVPSSNAFCCKGPANLPYCCNFAEYAQNNQAVMAGLVIGILAIILIPVICCICCCCACCPFYRVQRGVVLVR